MERFFSKLMRGRGRFFAVLELLRPWNGLSVGILTFIGALIALQAAPPVGMIILAGATTFIVYMAATSLNDVYDVNVDKVNMPYRPLQSESVLPKTAFYISVFLYALGIGMSFFVSFNFFLVICAMSILSIIYSVPPLEAKNRGLCGNIILGFETIFMSMYAGYVAIANALVPDFELLAGLSVFSLSFILITSVKDLKDIAGDRIYGKKTVAVVYSKNFIALLTTIGSFLLFLAAFLFDRFYFQNSLFLFISLTILILMLVVDAMVYRRDLKFGETAWGLKRLLSLLLILNLFFFSFYMAI